MFLVTGGRWWWSVFCLLSGADQNVLRRGNCLLIEYRALSLLVGIIVPDDLQLLTVMSGGGQTTQVSKHI